MEGWKGEMGEMGEMGVGLREMVVFPRLSDTPFFGFCNRVSTFPLSV